MKKNVNAQTLSAEIVTIGCTNQKQYVMLFVNLIFEYLFLVTYNGFCLTVQKY